MSSYQENIKRKSILLKHIRDNHIVRVVDLPKGGPSYSIYRRQFGSWSEAKRLAYNPTKPHFTPEYMRNLVIVYTLDTRTQYEKFRANNLDLCPFWRVGLRILGVTTFKHLRRSLKSAMMHKHLDKLFIAASKNGGNIRDSMFGKNGVPQKRFFLRYFSMNQLIIMSKDYAKDKKQ